MRFGPFDIWGVSGVVKFLSISVTLGFCAHYICGLHGTSLRAAWMLTALPTSNRRKKSSWRGFDIHRDPSMGPHDQELLRQHQSMRWAKSEASGPMCHSATPQVFTGILPRPEHHWACLW